MDNFHINFEIFIFEPFPELWLRSDVYGHIVPGPTVQAILEKVKLFRKVKSGEKKH